MLMIDLSIKKNYKGLDWIFACFFFFFTINFIHFLSENYTNLNNHFLRGLYHIVVTSTVHI